MKVAIGNDITIRTAVYDQFGVLLDEAPEITVDGDELQFEKGVLRGTGIGTGTIMAELGGIVVEHEIEVIPLKDADIAAGRPSTASSSRGDNNASMAFDQDDTTRWESSFSDPQWIQIDLGASVPLHRAVLLWENAHAKKYTLSISDDNVTWTQVYQQNNCKGGREKVLFPEGTNARFLRLSGSERNTTYGYSLWSFEVYRR